MVDRPAEAPRGLWCEISGQWRYRLVVVAGIVGELDGDRLGRALRYGAVQLLDRPLGLDALVEPYEADALRQAYPRGAEKVGGDTQDHIGYCEARDVSLCRKRAGRFRPRPISVILSCIVSFSVQCETIAREKQPR